MRPKGNIYKKNKSPLAGEVRLAMSKIERFAFRLLRGIGAGFVGFAVMGILFTYGPVIREELSYQFKEEGQAPVRSRFGDLIEFAEADRTVRVQNEAKSYGVGSYFSIVIPKIDASSNIIANVDAANEEDYTEALSQGVAHARGTYFPGQGRNIYLFSHSTDSPFNISRYNAVFYLLGKLEEGDRFIVFFADSKYEYEVSEKVVTGSDDTSWLNDTKSEEVLILQTCDPPGTTWRRLLVIAEPVGI